MLISLLLHLFLLLFFFSPIFHFFHFAKSKEKPAAKAITLTMVPPPVPKKINLPEKKHFIDSSQSLPTDKPDANARFESDMNTRAASKEKGEGPSDLPSQQGTKVPELNTRDTVFTPDRKGEIAPRPPVVTQPEPKPQPQPRPPTQPVVVSPPQQQSDQQKNEKALKRENELTLATKSPPTEEVKPSPPTPPTPPKQPQTEARPPPSSFIADRRKSAIFGGAQLGEESSIASQETILGRYKSKLYRAIGSRWYLYVQNRITLLNVGQVKIRFYIRSDGVIEKTEFTEGEANSTLGTLSRRAIMDVGTLEPFPDALKQQLGEGYWEDITFTIY